MSTHTAVGASHAHNSNIIPFSGEAKAKPRMSPGKFEESRAIQRLIEEQRMVGQRRQQARQELVEKILFHARRGMSRSTLESRWSREAVAEALDALSRDEREALRA